MSVAAARGINIIRWVIYAVPTVFALFHGFTHESSGLLRTELYTNLVDFPRYLTL